MIVTCPNCGARYRLSDEVVARGSRLKCAKCEHRWVPEAQLVAPEARVMAPEARVMAPEARVMAPEAAAPAIDAAPEAPAPESAAAALNADDSAIPVVPPDDEEEVAPARSPVLRSIAAIILGLALAIAAAGLWAGQIDVTRLPVVGPTLAGMVPAASKLEVTVAGKVTQLPAGGRVLDVTGTISNPGKRSVAVPVLKIGLSGPTGNVRRWTISPPVARLAPGESAAFASTVAGVPLDARTLSVTPGR